MVKHRDKELGVVASQAGFRASHHEQILVDVRWLALEEVPERDRAFLLSAGLLGVEPFARKVVSWA
jgi:hypothetical protein